MSDTTTSTGTSTGTSKTSPRPEKVAIVDEIASKLGAAQAVFVSEYRGMTVGHLANLRGALRPSDAEHKVYKNTLARLAVRTAGLE
ncbi:MAG: 50S ribosomal protein L10, partial [Ilumatobacteraceae bacterium]